MFQSVVTALLLAAPLVLGFSTDGTMLIKSVCITFEVQSHYTTAYPREPRKCGSHISDHALIAAENHFVANAVPKTVSNKLALDDANATIPVYFHVICSDSTQVGGNVS